MPADGPYVCTTPFESHRIRSGASLSHTTAGVIDPGEVVQVSGSQTCSSGNVWVKVPGGWSLFTNNTGDSFFKAKEVGSRTKNPAPEAKRSKQSRPRTEAAASALPDAKRVARHTAADEPTTPVRKEAESPEDVAASLAAMKPTTPLRDLPGTYDLGTPANGKGKAAAIVHHRFNLCDYADTDSFNDDLDTVCDLLDGFCSEQLGYVAGRGDAGRTKLSAVALKEEDLRPVLRVLAKLTGEGASTPAVDFATPTRASATVLRCVALLAESAALFIPGFEALSNQVLANILKAGHRSSAVVCAYLPAIFAPFLSEDADADADRSEDADDSQRRSSAEPAKLSLSRFEPVLNVVKSVYFAAPSSPLPAPGKRGTKRAERAQAAFQVSGIVDVLCSVLYATLPHLIPRSVAHYSPSTSLSRGYKACSGVAARLVSSLLLDSTLLCVVAPSTESKAVSSAAEHGQKFVAVCNELIARLLTADACASNMLLSTTVSQLLSGYIQPALKTDGNEDNFSGVATDERNVVLCCALEVLSNVSQQTKFITSRAKDVRPGVAVSVVEGDALPALSTAPPSAAAAAALLQSLGGAEALAERFSIGDLRHRVLPALGVCEAAERKADASTPRKGAKGGTKRRRTDREEERLLEEYGGAKETAAAEVSGTELEQEAKELERLDSLPNRYEVLTDEQIERIDAAKEKCVEKVAQKMDVFTVLASNGPLGNSKITKQQLTGLASRLGVKVAKSLNKEELASKLVAHCEKQAAAEKKASKNGTADTPQLAGLAYAEIDRTACDLSNLLQGETAGRRGFFVLTWGAHFTDTAQASADKALSTEAARHAAAKAEAVRAMAAVERYLPAKEWHFQQELRRICGGSFVPAEDEPGVAEDAERGEKKAKKKKKKKEEEEEENKQRADCVGLFLFLCTQTLEGFTEGADARSTRAVLCGRERAVGVIDSYKLVVRHIVLLFGSQKPSANAVVRKKAAAEIEALIAVDVGLVEDVWSVMRNVFYSKATGAFQPPPTLHEAYYDMLLLVAQKAHLLESYKFCTNSQTALPDGSTEKLLDHILHIGLNTLCRGTTVAVGNGAAAAPNAGLSLVVSKKVKKLLCCLITGRSHGQPSGGSAGCANPAAKKQVLSFVVRVLSEKLAEAGGGSAIVPLDFNPAVVSAYFDPELYTRKMNSACADQMYLMRVCLSPDDESGGAAKPAGCASAGAGLFLYLLKQAVLRGSGVGGDVSETPLTHDVVPAEEGRILTALMPFLIMLGEGATEQSGSAPSSSPTLDGNVVRSVAALLQEFLAAFNERRDAEGSAAVPGTPPRSFTYSDERGASGQTDSVHSLDDTYLLQGTAAEVLASASCSLLLFCVRLLTGALTHVVLCQVLKRRGGSGGGRTSPPASPLTPPRRRKGEKEKAKEAACRSSSPPLHTKEALPPQQELSCDADVVFLKDVLSPAALRHVVAGVVAFAENKVDSSGRVVRSTPDELLGFIHGIRILLQLVPFNFEGFFEGKGETTSCGAVVTALQTVMLMYARQYQNRILKLTATALSMVSVLRLRECGRQQPPLVYFAPASYSISGASSSLYTCYIAGANMTLSLRVFSKVFTTIVTVFLPQIEKGAGTPQHVVRAQQFMQHLCRGLYLVSLFVEAFDWTRRSLVAFLSDAVKGDEPAGAHNLLLGGKGVLHNVYKLLTETLRVVNIPLPADAPATEKVALAELRSKALAMVLKALKALCGQNATVYFKASQNLIATCIGVDSMQAAAALKCDGAHQASLPVLTTTELRAAALSLLYEFLAGEEKKLLEGSRHADGEATGTCAGPATSSFHLMKTPEKMHPEKRSIDQDSGVGSSLMHRFLPVVQHAMFSTDGRVRGLAQTLMQLCFDQGLSVPHLSLDFIIAANDAASNHTRRIAYDTDCYDLFRGEGGGKKARLHEAPVDTCAAKLSIPTSVVPAYLLSSFSFNSRTAKEYASLLASKICAAVQKKFIYCHYTCGVESVGRLRGVVSRQGTGVLESQISMELYLASQQSAAGGHGGVGLVTQLLRMLAQQDAVRRWMRGLRTFYHTVKLTDTDGVPGGAPATSTFPPLLLLSFPRFVGEAVSTLTVKKETHLQQMLDVANQGLLLELEELQTHVARLLGLTAAESEDESDGSGDGVPKAKRAKTAARAKGAAAARKAKAEAQRLAAEENVAKAGPDALLEVCVRGLCVVVLYELALWWKRSKGSAGGDAEDVVKADVSFTVPLSSAAYKTFLANIDKAASFHTLEGEAVSVTSDNLRALLAALQAISLDDKFLSSVAANGPKGAKRKPRAKPAKQAVQRKKKKKAAESSDEDSDDDCSTTASSSDESSDNDTSSSSSSASSAKKPAVRRKPAKKAAARRR